MATRLSHQITDNSKAKSFSLFEGKMNPSAGQRNHEIHRIHEERGVITSIRDPVGDSAGNPEVDLDSTGYGWPVC